MTFISKISQNILSFGVKTPSAVHFGGRKKSFERTPEKDIFVGKEKPGGNYSKKHIDASKWAEKSTPSAISRILSNDWESRSPDFKFQMGSIFSKLVDKSSEEGILRLEYRVKGANSIKEKLMSGSKENDYQTITTMDEAERSIGDAFGVRAVLKRGNQDELKAVYEEIKKGFKENPKIVITEFESCRSEPKLSFFEIGKRAHNDFEDFVKSRYSDTLKSFKSGTRDSGYTAVHINGKILANSDAPENIAASWVPFELQIVSENILKLYEPDHAILKIHQGKKVDKEYKKLEEAYNKLTPAEKKLYNEYRQMAYKYQRLKDLEPTRYAGSALYPLPYRDGNWSKVLDFNEIAKMTEMVEKRQARKKTDGDVQKVVKKLDGDVKIYDSAAGGDVKNPDSDMKIYVISGASRGHSTRG